jgi:hypothetical protein
VSFFVMSTPWKGIKAALRKQSGGLFLAVTEEFCEALRMKSAFMLRKIQEESLQVHQNKKSRFCGFFCFGAHTSREGFEAALRKQFGGLFLAVTKGFCKAPTLKSALMPCRTMLAETVSLRQ